MGCKGKFPQMMRDAGFRLRLSRDGPLDWRRMGSYETDRILREQNLEVVDEVLQHLSEAPLGTMLETHILDSGIAKYFIMSQYAIQYLLCCRTYLDETVGELREAHETAQQELAQLRQSLSASHNEILQLHKKITQIEAIREVVFPCHLCTKNFISNEALNIHIGRKHNVGTPTTALAGGGGGSVKDKDNDLQLINTIKMELEIKQLKERLNAAERNIKERSGSSRRQASPQQDQALTMRNVGIQSNLAECKEKDELSSETVDSEATERKEQLSGLADRLSSFEAWQTQLKQSNEQFIQDINQKLEDLSNALEQSKQTASAMVTTVMAATPEDRVATPSLEDLERLLTEKVAEIGKVSANKLEEVVNHLEMGYKDKLEALERELKRFSVTKVPVHTVHSSQTTSKIPKLLPKKDETNMERIKRQVESEFNKAKHDDDTYSIEELPARPAQSQPTLSKGQAPEQPVSSGVNREMKQTITQAPELPIGSSSGSHLTFTKSAVEPPLGKQIASVSQAETQETTDISGSLSEEGSISAEGSELLTSEQERQVFKAPKTKPTLNKSHRKPTKPLTRKDARKLVNQILNSHGISMKTKCISGNSLKRVTFDLAQHRNKLKLEYPKFYATRNRIRKFVEKLCSARMPERAEVLLKNTTPLQPMDVPKRRTALLTTTDDDDDYEGNELATSQDEEASLDSEQSHGSSPQKQQNLRNFKMQLEEMLAKPAAQVVARSGTTVAQMHQAIPVPLPRKRVMFNTTEGV